MARTTTLRRLAAVLAATLLLPGAFVAACSSNNDNPTPPVYTVPDTGTPVQPSDSGSSTSDSSGGGGGEDGPLTQKDGALVQDAATCESDAGCWSCTPASASQFLNQCTSSQCFPFQNAARLPNYDGGLPPLN